MKTVFVVEMAPYKEQLLVVVGCGRKRVLQFLRDLKADKRFVAMVGEDMASPPPDTLAFVSVRDGVPGTLMVMPELTSSRGWGETLVHELHHVVFFLAQKRGMTEEYEAQGHLMEWLFAEIIGRVTKEEGNG